ncbi:VWA domain-containing protein [Marinilabiliaceae bacterium JC040]|nr:VWA domain-containing protein [Marinilabiliaceae bacterium JC040]
MFRFQHVEILYLLVLVPLFVLLYYAHTRRHRRSIEEFGEYDLLNPLMPQVSTKRPFIKFILLLVSYIFVVFGVSGPQFGSKLVKAERKGVELVIALDISNSMMSTDIKPNRLEKAKRAIDRLIQKLGEDKLGLVVFAGEAYTQLPITTDYSSARLFLSGINPSLIAVQGTDIGSAIDLSLKSFTSNTKSSKAIILITDGENHEQDALEAAQRAKEMGIAIHTIGMGSPQGAPIPISGQAGQYHRDKSGNIVVSHLDEVGLKKIAAIANGIYVRANNTRLGLNILMKEISKMDKTKMESKVYSDYIERFQYFIAFALLLLFADMLLLNKKNKYLQKIKLF